MSGNFNHRKTSFERFRFLFRSKPDHFFERLMEQSQLTARGVYVLWRYMEDPTHQNATNIQNIEKQADEVRRMLIEELNRTFATPIDREDIFSLSRAIDDVLDYADTTVLEMDMLSVKPNKFLRDMAELLHETAGELQLSVERLQHHPAVANEHAMKAKAAENRIEEVYRKAIADLFHSVQQVEEVMEVLKLREVYRHLSNAADRGDQAANIISDIIVKTT